MGLTACTEPQCLYKGALYLTVELYLYSPYGSYGLYRASVPVQGYTLPYSRAIPLLPLWAVRPVQSLSACTRVHFSLFCLLANAEIKPYFCRDNLQPNSIQFRINQGVDNIVQYTHIWIFLHKGNSSVIYLRNTLIYATSNAIYILFKCSIVHNEPRPPYQ